MDNEPWTPEQDALLLSVYGAQPPPTHDQAWQQLVARGCQRTRKACQRRYERLCRKLKRTAPKQPTGATAGGTIDLGRLREVLRQPRSLRDLSRLFDRSEESVEQAIRLLKDGHYNIIQTTGQVRLDQQTVARPVIPRTLMDLESREVLLGLPSDTQFGSKHAQITAYRGYMAKAYAMGVRHFLYPGDIFAGNGKVYRGQIYDLVAITASGQLRYGMRVIPQWGDARHYMIGGNHDYSFIRENGYNIVEALASEREDVIYCGFHLADIPLTDQAEARLWHPRGGVPYAASYKLQKGMETASFDELTRAANEHRNPKLRAIFAGHLHIAMQMMMGTILGMQCGCFESQTGLLKELMKYPQVGGYVVRLRLTEAGLIQSVAYEWLQGEVLADDWRNYPELLEEPEVPQLEPLFQWAS